MPRFTVCMPSMCWRILRHNFVLNRLPEGLSFHGEMGGNDIIAVFGCQIQRVKIVSHATGRHWSAVYGNKLFAFRACKTSFERSKSRQEQANILRLSSARLTTNGEFKTSVCLNLDKRSMCNTTIWASKTKYLMVSSLSLHVKVCAAAVLFITVWYSIHLYQRVLILLLMCSAYTLKENERLWVNIALSVSVQYVVRVQTGLLSPQSKEFGVTLLGLHSHRWWIDYFH